LAHVFARPRKASRHSRPASLRVPAVDAACAEALEAGIASGDVILTVLARRRQPETDNGTQVKAVTTSAMAAPTSFD
jgi:hypothetical protein